METTIWQTYPQDEVVVVGIINTSNQTQINNFIEENSLTFPILFDPGSPGGVQGGDTYNDYYLPNDGSPYPRDFIVDQEGTLQYANNEIDTEWMHYVLSECLFETQSAYSQMVFAEDFTAAEWCPFCPVASLTMNELYDQNPEQIVSIQWQVGSQYFNEDDCQYYQLGNCVDARGSLYDVTGIPTEVFNGTGIVVGADIDWENFARYDSAFQSLSENMTDYDIMIDGSKEGSNINYSIDIVNDNDSVFYGHNLHVFIVEDSILTTWNYQGSGDSLAFARNVVRDWFTDSLSYDSSNGNQTFSGSFVVDQSQWNTDQIKIIAILQDELTNEVYQAVQQNVNHFESLDIDQNGLKETPNIPLSYFLYQNHPNPFNPTTRINYKLPDNEFVSIYIIDIMGREIKSLVNTNQEAGFKSVQWDATNNLGQSVSAGMYIYTIQAGEFRQTKKMVLLK